MAIEIAADHADYADYADYAELLLVGRTLGRIRPCRGSGFIPNSPCRPPFIRVIRVIRVVRAIRGNLDRPFESERTNGFPVRK